MDGKETEFHHRTDRQQKDEKEESPTKIGQRYELQRRIDEELRKLQLADGMDQHSGNRVNGSDPDECRSELESHDDVDNESMTDNGPPHQQVIDDYKLGADVKVLVRQNEKPVGKDAIAIPARDEINTLNDNKRSDFEQSLEQEERITEVQPDIKEMIHSQEMELEDAERCSTVTSPTTTTGTFTLPSQSPGTEGGRGTCPSIPETTTVTMSMSMHPQIAITTHGNTKEILPVDQPPSALCEPLALYVDSPHGLNVRKASSEVLGEKEPIEKKILSQEKVELKMDPHKHKSKETDAAIDAYKDVLPDSRNLQYLAAESNVHTPQESWLITHDGDVEETNVLGEAIEIGVEIAIQKFSGEVADDHIKADRPVAGDIDERDKAAIDNENIISDNIQTVEQDIQEEVDFNTAKLIEQQQNIVTDGVVCEVNGNQEQPAKMMITSTHQQVVENAEQQTEEHVVEESTKIFIESVSEGLQSSADITTSGDASSEQDVSETDEKFSTDDDEYSGYDIDMSGSTLRQEETLIADEGTVLKDSHETEEYQPTKACNSEDVPLFADVRYTVGEQICSRNKPSGDDVSGDSDHTASEDNESPRYTDAVPWSDDSLLLLDSPTPVQDLSFPLDKADTRSSNGRNSLNESLDTFDEEAGSEIARETVSNVIKAAYGICLQCSSNGDQKVEGENAPDTSTDREDYSLHRVENVTREQSADAVIDEIRTVNDTSQTEVEISPIESVTGARGNDVAPLEDTRTEEFATSHTSETAFSQRDENTAAQCLAEGEVSRHLQPSVVLQLGNKNRDEGVSAKIVHAETSLWIEDHKDTSKPHKAAVEVGESGIVDKSSGKSNTAESDMSKIQESPGNARNFPERITYNPALSRRNTEATKWFGQPTCESKMWLTSSGKVDENAELERRKLIKAMTRRNNPNVAPKWQPLKEKDFTENLDKKQRESLKKYEERRRSRSGAEAPRNDKYTATMLTVHDSAVLKETMPSKLPRENIVIESVVHSRDAIGIWETRLSEKQHKETLEKQRLSVGKQKRPRNPAYSDVNGRTRNDSTSSASSNASGVFLLHTSEHIERESMDLSKVRNRWKNIEEESIKAKPEPVVKNRRSNFTVNTAPTFRSFQSPATAAVRPVNATPAIANRGGPAVVRPSQNKESFIDREIREAAEREEKWKHEQWEKMSEMSVASSEDVFPDNAHTPSSDKNVVATVYTQQLPAEDLTRLDIVKDADRDGSWKAEHDAQKVDTDSIRHRSKDSSGLGSDIASPPPQRFSINQQEVDLESLSSCGSSSPYSSPPVIVNDSPKKVNLDIKHQEALSNREESSSPDVEITSNVDSGRQEKVADIPTKTQDEESRVRRLRIASLTNAVAPKGWEPKKGRAVGPVSPVSPVHRSVPKPEAKSPQSPKLESVGEPLFVQHVSPTMPAAIMPVLETKAAEEQVASELQTPLQPKNVKRAEFTKSQLSPSSPVLRPSPAQDVKKGGPIFQKKSGGPIDVSSSKSRLQSIMEKEMQDAAAREEEWRKKQLELVSRGIDLSPHPVVHSTREVRTPAGATPPPAVNSGEQQPAQLRRSVKSLFADDDIGELPRIRDDDSSNEYKKRAESHRYRD